MLTLISPAKIQNFKPQDTITDYTQPVFLKDAKSLAKQLRSYSISELSKNCPAVLGATPQKIRPLLTGLIKSNAVVRTEEKGKPLFTKVDEE